MIQASIASVASESLVHLKNPKMSSFSITELMHDRLTTGKIYAGKIILENWRAYKECMIRGDAGPKPVCVSLSVNSEL